MLLPVLRASILVLVVRPAMQRYEMLVLSLGWEDPLKEAMAAHSNILAWRIPWTEEPGRLQSTGLQDSDMTERLTHTQREERRGG